MKIGIGILLVLSLLGLAAPWIQDSSKVSQMDLERRLEAPNFSSPMGRDDNGIDVLSQVIYGARTSLSICFFVISISMAIGLFLGSVSGYFGGHTDNFIMRTVDLFSAFPNFLLALMLVAFLGPSLFNLILALSFTTWAGFARLVRGEVLVLKEKDYIQSAHAIGAGHPRILLIHIIPNLLGLVTIQASFAAAGAIISETGLSFLGLGVPTGTASWGGLLNSGREFLWEAPHISLFPGITIVLVVLGFNLVGEGLRDYFDPKKSISFKPAKSR